MENLANSISPIYDLQVGRILVWLDPDSDSRRRFIFSDGRQNSVKHDGKQSRFTISTLIQQNYSKQRFIQRKDSKDSYLPFSRKNIKCVDHSSLVTPNLKDIRLQPGAVWHDNCRVASKPKGPGSGCGK